MTNEKLEYYCRNADVSNAKWAILEKVAILDLPDPESSSPYVDFIVLFQDGVRVGAVLPMGNVDLHMLTLPEHRGKGYMSSFFRTGIYKLLRPKFVIATCGFQTLEENEYYAEVMTNIENGTDVNVDWEYKQQYEDEDKKRREIAHIMALAGIKVVYSDRSLKYLEGGKNKIKIPVACPYCGKSKARVWGSYVVYSSYIEATGATHHIVDYDNYKCPYCKESYSVTGGFVEYPANECHFHTLTGG